MRKNRDRLRHVTLYEKKTNGTETDICSTNKQRISCIHRFVESGVKHHNPICLSIIITIVYTPLCQF